MTPNNRAHVINLAIILVLIFTKVTAFHSASTDGVPAVNRLRITEAAMDPQDAVNKEYLTNIIDNLSLCTAPVWPTVASVSCLEGFSVTQGGVCATSCLSPDLPYPSVAAVECSAGVWNETVVCSVEAPSCAIAVAVHGPGVHIVKNAGQVYCDEDGYGVFASVAGSTSGVERYFNPANDVAATSYTTSTMGKPSPVNPSGQLQYSHITAGTPIRMKCSTNSGATWTTFDIDEGFADYSAGDKGDGSYSGIWGVIAISMEWSRHGNSICGPLQSTSAEYSGVGICRDSPNGWPTVMAAVWSTSSGTLLGCDGDQTAGSQSDTSRFMLLMKV
eukprot:TRINITY_DN5045_c0_g1_i1.p1 TRINITY_DN5045_c0_g1~~TRINITY_DN5045_c0_g1_i1.p1  ORF type:complete len:367 (-),score=31.53 TRINITY_DN5045_c0_g1_i1:19-1011(-)